MENVRIIELQENTCILALYNPDDVYEHGLTSSEIQIRVTEGPDEMMKFVIGITQQCFEDEVGDSYDNYVPVALHLMKLPDNRVLPAMILANKQSNFFPRYIREHQIGRSSVDGKAQQYIAQYIEEFENEKNGILPVQEQEPADKTSTHQFLFRFNSLGTAMDACFLIPFDKCIESSLVKCNNRYYLMFTCAPGNYESVVKNSNAIIEFGTEENMKSMTFIREHGTLISQNLSKMVQNLYA